MEMNLPVTLSLTIAIAALFFFASHKAKEPAQPLKVRMINYHIVQLACIVAFLVLGAHLATLVLGLPSAGAGQAPPTP